MNGRMNDPLNNPLDNAGLTDTLNKRADDFARLGGHDLDLAQVVSRAGEIQRGRRMRASMVMAAVLVAVAVPVGITVLSRNDPSQQPTPAPISHPGPDHSRIVLGDLDPGALPRTGLIRNGVWERPDGAAELPPAYRDELATVQLSRAFGTADGLMLVSGDDAGNNTVRYWSPTDTNQTKTWPIDNDVAVSPDGNVAAFAQPDGTVTVVQDDGSRYFDLGKIPDEGGYSVAGVTGENCAGRSDLEDTCEVLVSTLGAEPHTWRIDAHGRTEKVYPGFRQLSGISSDGDAAGITSYTDSGACSAVENAAGSQLWENCTYRLISFSPGGDYLLAANAENDGPGDKDLTVLDAKTGRVVLHLGTVDSAYVPLMVWEDASHVLAVVTDAMSSSVQRIAVDGNRTNAYPVTPTDDSGRAFELVRP